MLESQIVFSAALDLVPKSTQADKSRLAEYKRSLETIASSTYGGSILTEGPLYSRIIWFHRGRVAGDVDNIVKPILDALEGVIYSDDFLIAQSLVTRIDVTKGEFELVDHGAPAVSYQDIVGMLGSGVSDILYIEIGRMDSKKVVFGPIDGGTV